MLTAQQIIELLRLEPLTIEGGYFRETYRSKLSIPSAALPNEYGGHRCVLTAIYYLLTPETFSAIHRVKSDEMFHFYAGDPVEMLQLRPGGNGETIVVGNDLAAGQAPQVLVPAGVWQGCRLAAASPSPEADRCGWALLGCTVAPGFDYADFEAGQRGGLKAAYPEFTDLIAALTRS